MTPRRELAKAVPLLAALLMAPSASRADPAPPTVAGARLDRLSFDRLQGWLADDHHAAWQAFRRSCKARSDSRPALRPADAAPDGLAAACRAALDLTGPVENGAAREFFERFFEPVEVVPPSGKGFLTGYFEPEYEGSLDPAPGFGTPLLGRPDDLVTVPQGQAVPGLDAGLEAARLGPEGYKPYPDRAAIEEGALGARARPVAYVREPAEAFIIQVQGSARLRLRDGRLVRVAYAGRNGWPYTSIGRILVEEGRIPRNEMSLERLMAWLVAHPEEARGLMRRNRSYVFFRLANELAPGDGPIGGAGHPLTPGRSLAVDRTVWSYGLPIWLEGELPLPQGGSEPLRRLMVAQDTGTAIVGPARGDFYFGSGAEAGTRAGLLRHPVRFVVLRPRPSGPSGGSDAEPPRAAP